MAAGREEFERQLRELDYSPDPSAPGNWAIFKYKVPGGKFEEQVIDLAFDVPTDFPRTPPGGPNIRPQLLPIGPGNGQHPTKVDASNLGTDWEYWSRPYINAHRPWRGRETVQTYLAHIDNLFQTIP